MAFSIKDYRDFCNKVKIADNNISKGTALENLIQYTMNSLDGISVTERDVRTPFEEIDFILMNEKTHPVFLHWDNVILVECKNWSKPVDVSAIDHFIATIYRKGLNNGILIAANGVTGNLDHDAAGIINAALKDKIRLIVITWSDLSKIKNQVDIYTMIKCKYGRLFLGKIP